MLSCPRYGCKSYLIFQSLLTHTYNRPCTNILTPKVKNLKKFDIIQIKKLKVLSCSANIQTLFCVSPCNGKIKVQHSSTVQC
jgi:hypothetical protein